MRLGMMGTEHTVGFTERSALRKAISLCRSYASDLTSKFHSKKAINHLQKRLIVSAQYECLDNVNLLSARPLRVREHYTTVPAAMLMQPGVTRRHITHQMLSRLAKYG